MASDSSKAAEDRFFLCNGKRIEIRDVWADNLEQEMEVIRGLVDRYPYVAMDTEFPGIVGRPLGSFNSAKDFHYQMLRYNVGLLRIIQLGITFANERGEIADNCPTWQFNFSFNLEEDMYSQDSIDLLVRSGIDFEGHKERGIDVEAFAELLMSSGLVLNPEINWISFHSGYDFGYLLKLLTCAELPADEPAFFDTLRLYFPRFFDVKYLMLIDDNFKGGLQKLAQDLDVERVGPMHQAGSDSLLTAATYFKLRDTAFHGRIDDAKYLGQLYGLGSGGASYIRDIPVTPA